MPMIEFVWWPATAEFLADVGGVINPTVKHISSAEGCLGIYYGLQEEDKTKFWMIVVWISHAHHQVMMNSADYALMVGRLKPYFRGELGMNHVEFDKDITAVLGAPMTVISFLRSAADHAARELHSVMEIISSNTSATWGTTQEEADLTILLVGRDGNEVCEEFSELYPKYFEDVQKRASIELLHVKFANMFQS